MKTTRIPAPWENETYSDSVTVPVPGGRFIFVSGQIGVDPEGKVVEGGPRAEADQLFERLRMVLEKSGGGLEHVVKVAAWVVNPDENFGAFSDARGHAFAGHLPACAKTVEMSEGSFGTVFEMDAVAFVPDDDQ